MFRCTDCTLNQQHFPLQLPSTLHGTKAPQGAPSRPNLNPKELRSYIANMKVVQVLQLTSELILVWQSLNSDANALKDGTLFSAMNQRVQSCLAYLSVPMRERAHSDSLQVSTLRVGGPQGLQLNFL